MKDDKLIDLDPTNPWNKGIGNAQRNEDKERTREIEREKEEQRERERRRREEEDRSVQRFD